jgi:phage-related baseplate assembly protein
MSNYFDQINLITRTMDKESSESDLTRFQNYQEIVKQIKSEMDASSVMFKKTRDPHHDTNCRFRFDEMMVYKNLLAELKPKIQI